MEKIRIIGANSYFYSVVVPKFYHDRASTNFYNYKGKMKIRRSLGSFYERAVYIYNKKDINTCDINDSDQDWCFLDKYSKIMGFSIRGFEFTFPDSKDPIKSLITPSFKLINEVSGTEEGSVPSKESFNPQEKPIRVAIENYKNKLSVNYINESYFLYDKSDLIKETYITELNRKVLIYGSISYFNKKTENEIFRIVSPENYLKFYVERDAIKNNLNFQLTSVSGPLPKLKDKKIYNFSLTQIGEKRKRQIVEPIETVIMRGQQKLKIENGLNPEEIEINHDRILNILKKQKNVKYRLTPLGMLFLASVEIGTEQIFVTCRELNDMKKISVKR